MALAAVIVVELERRLEPIAVAAVVGSPAVRRRRRVNSTLPPCWIAVSNRFSDGRYQAGQRQLPGNGTRVLQMTDN